MNRCQKYLSFYTPQGFLFYIPSSKFVSGVSSFWMIARSGFPGAGAADCGPGEPSLRPTTLVPRDYNNIRPYYLGSRLSLIFNGGVGCYF